MQSDSSDTALARSIYDLPPLSVGGMEARNGFAFQDHVAVGFCLEMLENSKLLEVWCESLDDITLIWEFPGDKCAEFIQVKGSEMNQLWSVAKLCERETKTHSSGQSIMEKSLAQDRCKEPCRFRIVTARPVMSEIEILTFPQTAPARINGKVEFDAIHKLMEPKVGSSRSLNGNDYKFWTERMFWDVRHTNESVHDANILKLSKFLSCTGIGLAPDQLEELYTKLLKKVWDASRIDPRVFPNQNRIKRIDFEPWIMRVAHDMGLPAAGAPGKLEEKMQRASLAPDLISTAVEQIRYYRGEQLSPKYLDLDQQRFIQGEVSAILQSLKSRIDNGQLADDGGLFHGLCLEELEKLRNELPISPKPPLAFLQGCMYNITGRCLHRFRRITA